VSRPQLLTMPRIVRIDTLSPGARFTPAYGGHWTYVREGHMGLHHARRSDGYASEFAACAEVERGWLDRGWKEGDRHA